MADITYTDKDKTGSGVVTQWRDLDANEVKTKVNTKVDKVTGKALSTEDYSTAEKSKLAGIAAGATVNDSDANLKARANHTGTQLAATISDFQTQVTANTDNTANTAARHTHSNSTALNAVTGVNTGDQDLSGKQNTLVSATNIKTINGATILGSGDLTVGEGGGTGDVVGPASAVNNRVVFFDSTTGKLIKDSGLTLAGSNTGDQDLSGKQDLDSDLTAIAGLSPTNDDILQRKAGAWINRTPAQIKTDLVLVKGDVGLGSVDNTADTAKPVSTAQQTALDLKAPIASPTFTGTVSGITKSMVGLGSADNTSDAGKPVSTATQTALDLKAPLASPTFTGNLTTPTVKITGGSPGLGKALISDADGDASWIDQVQTITFIIDGGGSAITTGIKGDLEIPFACTINRVTLLADQSGSIVVDIWKDTYANYPPVVGDSITASAKPTITTATKSQDATLTGWTTAITAGDILRFNVDSVTTIQRCTLSLKITKT